MIYRHLTGVYGCLSDQLRAMAAEGTAGVREISIAASLAKSVKKSRTPLPLLFYTTDTHQFAGLFEVHPEGIAIESQQHATAVVYRRMQLVPISLTAVRAVCPKLTKDIARQLKHTYLTCVILNSATDMNKLLMLMMEETLQRRQVQSSKLLDGRLARLVADLERCTYLTAPQTPPPTPSDLHQPSESPTKSRSTIISSSDVLRALTGRRTLLVGDLLIRQIYRHLLALLQGRAKDYDPDNTEFGEMSFENDVLLSRSQTSVWSPDYVEEREMRSSKPVTAINPMLREAAPTQSTRVRLYYLSALTGANVEDVINHIATVADMLHIDDVYICFGAMQPLVAAAPTSTFLPHASALFEQLMTGLTERLQCSVTCLLNPPSSCGEMPASCPASEADRAPLDLQLQLLNSVTRALQTQCGYNVVDLWSVGAALLSDQLDDGVHYHTDAIQKFIFEMYKPFFNGSKPAQLPKLAPPEEALLPGRGLSQRQLEVPLVSVPRLAACVLRQLHSSFWCGCVTIALGERNRLVATGDGGGRIQISA